MDPISLTASVISMATLAYDSSMALHRLIQTYRHADKIFEELSTDISGLQVVLSSLQTIGGEDKGERFSQAQCHLLREVEPAILNCSDALKTFNVKVGKLFSNSTSEHVSKRDKAMLHFKTNDIAAVRVQLENYKSTLTVALLVTSIKSTSESGTEITSKIDSVANYLTGQMGGLKLAIQAVEDAGTSSQLLLSSIAQATESISCCGNVCKAAAEVAPVQKGATYRSVQAFNDAKFMMASTNTQAIAEGSTRVFSEVVGRDRARVWIGDTDAKTALDFMK